MERSSIYKLIDEEREYQIQKWGIAADDLNTPHDWITYIAHYLGRAYTIPFNKNNFRSMMVKVVALAVAVLEREDYALIKFQEKQNG